MFLFHLAVSICYAQDFSVIESLNLNKTSSIKSKPFETCVKGEDEVKWRCPIILDRDYAESLFMIDNGSVIVIIKAKGFLASNALKKVSIESYGLGCKIGELITWVLDNKTAVFGSNEEYNSVLIISSDKKG